MSVRLSPACTPGVHDTRDAGAGARVLRTYDVADVVDGDTEAHTPDALACSRVAGHLRAWLEDGFSATVLAVSPVRWAGLRKRTHTHREPCVTPRVRALTDGRTDGLLVYSVLLSPAPPRVACRTRCGASPAVLCAPAVPPTTRWARTP